MPAQTLEEWIETFYLPKLRALKPTSDEGLRQHLEDSIVTIELMLKTWRNPSARLFDRIAQQVREMDPEQIRAELEKLQAAKDTAKRPIRRNVQTKNRAPLMTWSRRWKAAAKRHRTERSPGVTLLCRVVTRQQEKLRATERRIARLEGPDAATLGRVYSNSDAWLKIAGISDAETLQRLLNGNLDVAVILEHEFERRFPLEHATWDREHT
jgi:hypothetical protein